MAHQTIQWGKGPANDDGRRERSRDNRPNREPDLFEALGVKRDAAVAAAIEAVRDSLDGFDPGLLTTATPGRRISSVPAIRARISGMAMPAVVGPASAAPIDVFDDAIANDDQSISVPGLNSKRRRGSNAALKWTLAFAVSIVTGALAGRASRQHPVRATSVHIATAVGPAVATIARTAAPVHVAPAPAITPPVHVEPVRNALPAVAAIEVEQPEADAEEAPVERGRHHHHRGAHDRAAHDVLAHAAPAPEAAAVIAAPAAPSPPVAVHTEPLAPAPIAPSARIEAANTRANASTSSSSCAARCAGDLSCAADCVVHGARVAREAEIPSAPAARVSDPVAPELPRRDAVVHAIESLQSEMRACAGDDRRTAFLTINFASTGRVTTAVTEAPYAGTPAGSCMARAARGATVPAFTRPSFSVRAPFAMR